MDVLDIHFFPQLVEIDVAGLLNPTGEGHGPVTRFEPALTGLAINANAPAAVKGSSLADDAGIERGQGHGQLED